MPFSAVDVSMHRQLLQSVAACEVKAAPGAASRFLRRGWGRYRERLEVEPFESWNERHSAHAWRQARLLGGGGIVPKKRRYNLPRMCRPSCAEWMEYMGKSGPEGGRSAEKIDWKAWLEADILNGDGILGGVARSCHQCSIRLLRTTLRACDARSCMHPLAKLSHQEQ